MSRQVGVRFTDNQSGTGTTIQVTVQKQDQNVSTLLANTASAKDGFLSAIELQSNFQGVILTVKDNGNQVAQANGSANNVAPLPQRTKISQLSINLSLSS